MALGRGPDLGKAIGIDARGAGMRLDISLVHGRCLELLLDDDISLGKALLQVADLKFKSFRDIRRLRRRRFDAAGDHVFEQERRIRLHRLVDIDDVRQDLVIDLEQCGGLFGNRFADRCDGGDRVALIERLFAGDDVARDVPEILRHPLRTHIFEFLVGEIG